MGMKMSTQKLPCRQATPQDCTGAISLSLIPQAPRTESRPRRGRRGANTELAGFYLEFLNFTFEMAKSLSATR